MRAARAPLAKLGVAIAIVVLLAPMTPVTLTMKLAPSESAVAVRQSSLTDASCLIREEAPRLDALPAGTIFAPLDIGPTILLRSHHSVVATGHHRAEEAMADVIQAYISPPDEAQAIVASRDADYIALCANLTEPSLYAYEAPDGLAARLREGAVPEWLEPIALDGSSSEFLVYRVRR